KMDFLKIFALAHDKALTEINIVSAFKKCGLYGDRQYVLDKINAPRIVPFSKINQLPRPLTDANYRLQVYAEMRAEDPNWTGVDYVPFVIEEEEFPVIVQPTLAQPISACQSILSRPGTSSSRSNSRLNT